MRVLYPLSPERQERLPAKELFLQTESGWMRGRLIGVEGRSLVMRVLATHDGIGVGTRMKIDRDSLRPSQAAKFSLLVDEGASFGAWRMSSPVKRAGLWETAPVSFAIQDFFARANLSGSSFLPPNTVTDERTYADALSEYAYHEGAAAYAQAFPSLAKQNIAFGYRHGRVPAFGASLRKLLPRIG